MTLPINKRLKAVRTALKLSQRDFTKGIYTAQSVYARMESGKQPVNERIIELVCYKYGIERAYLRDGKTDKIFSDIPPDAKSDHLYRIFIELNELFQDYLIIQAKELLRTQNLQGEQGQKPASKTKTVKRKKENT
jgi:transcriptional regulator with XRE-family HTH domain